jgi:hypothetical protein
VCVCGGCSRRAQRAVGLRRCSCRTADLLAAAYLLICLLALLAGCCVLLARAERWLLVRPVAAGACGRVALLQECSTKGQGLLSMGRLLRLAVEQNRRSSSDAPVVMIERRD